MWLCKVGVDGAFLPVMESQLGAPYMEPAESPRILWNRFGRAEVSLLGSQYS